jgi:hypothetical protein
LYRGLIYQASGIVRPPGIAYAEGAGAAPRGRDQEDGPPGRPAGALAHASRGRDRAGGRPGGRPARQRRLGGVRRDGILIPLPPHPRRAEFCDGSWNGTGHACIRDVRDHALALARDLGLPIWVDDLPRRLAFPKDCGIEVIRPR